MQTKKIILPAIALLSVILIVSMVSAAITFNRPSAAGQTVNGTFIFNVTSGLNHATNCTWSTTANANFATTRNNTGSQTIFFNSTNTATLTNAEDTNLQVLCTNLSLGTEQNNLTINVDNTAPVCSFTVDRLMVKKQDPRGAVVTDASTDTTDLNWSYILRRSDNSIAATSTAQNPTFSQLNFNQLGVHNIGLVLTDEAGQRTACATNASIVVQSDSSTAEQVVITQQAGEKTSNMKTMIIIGGGAFLLFACGVLLFLGLNASKKK